jgi:hypothetical protein
MKNLVNFHLSDIRTFVEAYIQFRIDSNSALVTSDVVWQMQEVVSLVPNLSTSIFLFRVPFCGLFNDTLGS